ncbi:hypothetical protein ACN47E_000181 [Coniothyrium glycines]
MTGNVTFTPREMEVLALAWQCMETPPKINMAKLAALANYTPGSAGVMLGAIKRKIKLLEGASASAGAGSAGAGAPSTPKKGGGAAGRKTGTPGKRGASAGASATPRKRQKAGLGVRQRGEDGEDDEEELVVRGETKVKVEKVEDEESGEDGGAGLLAGLDCFAEET